MPSSPATASPSPRNCSVAATNVASAAVPTTRRASSAWARPAQVTIDERASTTVHRVGLLRDRLADQLAVAIPGTHETGVGCSRAIQQDRWLLSPVLRRHRERSSPVPARTRRHLGLGCVVVFQRCPRPVTCARGDGLFARTRRRLRSACRLVPPPPMPTSDAALTVVPAAVARLRSLGS